MESINIRIVIFDSIEQKETIKLRDKVLRKPLGLTFFEKQLREEKDDIHIAAYHKNELIGCLILHKSSSTHIKMRQVAVDPDHQRKSVGNQMVAFCHTYAKENNYKIIYCHAREVARVFYEKLGYNIIGNSFEEVNLKHWKMEFEL